MSRSLATSGGRPLLGLAASRRSVSKISGRFIFGPEVEEFEREAAAYLGVPHAIGVANGTDALVLSLEAMAIGRGDEAICPSFTFYATAEAIARVGARPVCADYDRATVEAIRRSVEADSRGDHPQEGLLAAVADSPERRHCTACFSGRYPVAVSVPDEPQLRLFEKARA